MSNIKVFEDKKIRTQWNEQEEDWYFSVVDIVSVLTDKDYDNARKYWKVLKGRLKNEGSELVSFCYQLKLPAQDGKLRETDVLNTKGILRLVQSIPSKKAEPFKMWLAEVGSERLEEIADPQKAIDRAVETYRQKGYSEEWITQRMMTIKMTTIKMMVMTTTRTIISTTAIMTIKTIIPITATILKITATTQITALQTKLQTALQTKRTVLPKQQAVQQILQLMEKQQTLQAKLPQLEQVLLPLPLQKQEMIQTL